MQRTKTDKCDRCGKEFLEGTAYQDFKISEYSQTVRKYLKSKVLCPQCFDEFKNWFYEFEDRGDNQL